VLTELSLKAAPDLDFLEFMEVYVEADGVALKGLAGRSNMALP
jgi:hypothetical protein